MIDDDTILTFEALDDPPGIEVVDQVERLRYRLNTPAPVSLTDASTHDFLFPVDSAVGATVEAIAVPNVVGVCVRNAAGEMITEVDHLDEESVGEGRYILELSAQIKTYVVVDGPIDVTADLVETRIEFDGPTELSIGAASWHDRPAATVTTTDDPADMMTAVSTFGSALKTTSPERSFPSNRGHPPAVELGDSPAIPDPIQPPETGVRLEIPEQYEAIYTVAPLAYYLGAEVVPGQTPRLVTDGSEEFPLDEPNGLERGVERTFKQLFILDCITRTEGIYEIALRERNAIEEYVDLDFASLYDQPLAEQVATYLDVPYALLEDHVPEWRLTVHVEPKPATVEHLPFVADDLAIVRTADTPQTAQPASGTDISQTLTRNDVITRSAAEPSTPEDVSYVEPQSTSSLEQAWIGDSIPIGASKLTTEAFQNRLDRDMADGDISITIVLNDDRMAEESDLVNHAYGDRENLPFDVTVRRGLTVDELREQLRQETSFLHYIGHTERDGFECVDGKLDVSNLDDTGVDAFLLNACNSYQQGLGLIEAGAIGGIVTLNDIINDGAVTIGETIARLLNAGFPLRAALTIAREESVLGGQYIVVGDGGMTVTQAPSRTPTLLEITPVDGKFELVIKTYATDDAALGSVYMPHLSGNDEYFLSSGKIETFNVSKENLTEFLQLENMPVRINDSLCWTSTMNIDELKKS